MQAYVLIFLYLSPVIRLPGLLLVKTLLLNWKGLHTFFGIRSNELSLVQLLFFFHCAFIVVT